MSVKTSTPPRPIPVVKRPAPVPKPPPHIKPLVPKKPPAPPAKAKGPPTIVFSESLEKGDFLKTPRALIYIRAFDHPKAKQIKARHIHLILALAGKKFQKKMLRRYWARLAQDLGVGTDTARKWAYQLKKMGLIKIIQFTGKEKLPPPKPLPKARRSLTPGFRNDANGFDLSPLIELITEAAAARKAARLEKVQKYGGGYTK